MIFTPKEIKKEIIRNWTDADGLVALEKNPKPRSCDNGLLFSSTFIMLCHFNKILTDKDVNRYYFTVQKCRRFEKMRHIDGLYNRNPNRNADLNQHDDYDGVSTTSFLIGEPLYKDIYDYGKKHFWAFNNVNPGSFKVNGKFSFRVFRLPHQIALYKLLNGKNPGIIGGLWLIGAIITSAFGRETSNKIINWMRLEALVPHSKLFKLLKKWFMRRIKKKFKGPMGDGMTEVFRIYYPENHPMIMLAKHYVNEA